MTMARDEADMLPRWIDYYGRQLGFDNLIVLDDNSVDGSTDDLPCTRYRLPPAPWKRRWAKTRARLVNGIADGLLACYDVVLFTDTDEFLVADPAKYSGLVEYLADRHDKPVIAPLALELVHNTTVEPPLDPARPLLQQRRFVKFSPGMCKPLLKRTGVPWQHAFHAIRAPFEVDPDLWLLHLKYHDVTVLQRVSEHRRTVHQVEGRGSAASFWAMSPEELTSLLSLWTDSAGDTGSVPEFAASEADLDLVREQDDGYWRSTADQVTDLETTPLRVLPDRFLSAL